MKNILFLVLVAMATALCASPSFAGDPQPAPDSHSWTSTDVPNDGSVTTPLGTTVSKTGSAGTVKVKTCPGKETNPGAHGPHEVVTISGGANGSVSGAGPGTTVTISGSGTLGTVSGDGCTVNIEGDSGTAPNGAVTITGNGNDINLNQNCQNWSVGVIGNNNDIDLNNCNSSNTVYPQGTGNSVHN